MRPTGHVWERPDTVASGSPSPPPAPVAALRARIPLPMERIEARLQRVLGQHVCLEEEARNSRLFVVDFRLLLRAVQSVRPTASRDSRWRQKYLPAPIGVFLARSDRASGLLPLAIQIDQPQSPSEYNPVYTPDDGWGWIVAKPYF